MADEYPGLGWLADEEQRGLLHETATPFKLSGPMMRAPEKYDPRSFLKVENQGQVGSCTGHASSTCSEICENIETKGGNTQLSRGFCYIMGQRESGITGDRGATISGIPIAS